MNETEKRREPTLRNLNEVADEQRLKRAYAAKLLVLAIEEEASRRRHVASDLAIALGIHPSHWYRLRAKPSLLARCERITHESIATYLGWPLGRVLMASGMVEQRDLEFALGGTDVINDCLVQIERGPLGASLVHPLRDAPRDHQLLVAELYFSLKKEMARALARTEASGSQS